VSHRHTGPAGIAGVAGLLAVLGTAAVALLLGGSSTAVTAPAPSPVPGAPHGTSEANGAVVYGRYAPHSSTFVAGLTIAGAAGGPQRVVSARAVCCTSIGGHTILFTQRTRHGSRDLLLASQTDGTVLRPLTLRGMELGPGVLSADGSRIAVWARQRADPHRGAVEVHAGGRWYRIGRFTAREMRPLAFSPVGSWVLVFRPTTDRGFGEVGVLDIGSARYHRLTPRGMGSWCCFFGSPASWSPDGRVAFAAFQHVPQGDAFTDGQSAVFVTQRGTEGVRRVTDWGQWTTSAHWSPDSRLLAYDTANERGGAHDLFVIDPDGGSPSLVPTPNDGGSCCAVWTPNGKALVYESGSDDAHMDLWAANLDGSGTFRLTSGNARDLAYAITPWP
jgi:hypothetical protein